MKLFIISQDVNNDYDTYSDAVVCAKDKEDAKTIHPSGSIDVDKDGYFGFKAGVGNRTEFERYSSGWVEKAEQVKVKLIGTAKSGLKRGIVCVSFHAG